MRSEKAKYHFHTLLAEEYERERAMSSVDHAVIEELKVTLNNWGGLAEGRPIGIIDRFLVYQDLTIRNLLDIKSLPSH